MEKAKIQKWQIWRQILSDLPTYLHQISSDAAWHTYLPKNLTSYLCECSLTLLNNIKFLTQICRHRQLLASHFQSIWQWYWPLHRCFLKRKRKNCYHFRSPKAKLWRPLPGLVLSRENWKRIRGRNFQTNLAGHLFVKQKSQ